MKSNLGKMSGVMILLVITIATIVVLKQTNIVKAENGNQYNETVLEQINISNSLENNFSNEKIEEIFNVPSALEIDWNVKENLPQQTTVLSAGADPNPVLKNQNTTLWCDYRNALDNSSISNAAVKFGIKDESFIATFNSTSQRYEYTYTPNKIGNIYVSCHASSDNFESNSTGFNLVVKQIKEKSSYRLSTDLSRGKIKLLKDGEEVSDYENLKGYYEAEIEIPGRAKARISGLNVNDDLSLIAEADYINPTQPIENKILTPVFALEDNFDFKSSEIFLEKRGEVNAILKCPDWNFNDLRCDGNWTVTKIKFEQNETYVWFNISSFSAYAGASITIINPYTYVKDNDTWTVAFNTTGTADLIINSTNANWTEFLNDNTDTFDEMRFLEISCGNESIKDRLYVIDENGEQYKYSDLGENDSIRVKKLFIPNYSCDETGYLKNFMIKAGYATLQFTFGDQVGYAYDVTTFWAMGSTFCTTTPVSCSAGGSCSDVSTCQGASSCPIGCAVTTLRASNIGNNCSWSWGGCECSGSPTKTCKGSISCTLASNVGCQYQCNPGYEECDGVYNYPNGCECYTGGGQKECATGACRWKNGNACTVDSNCSSDNCAPDWTGEGLCEPAGLCQHAGTTYETGVLLCSFAGDGTHPGNQSQCGFNNGHWITNPCQTIPWTNNNCQYTLRHYTCSQAPPVDYGCDGDSYNSQTITCASDQAAMNPSTSCTAASTSNYCGISYPCNGNCDRNASYKACDGTGNNCLSSPFQNTHYDYSGGGTVCSGVSWQTVSPSYYCGSIGYTCNGACDRNALYYGCVAGSNSCSGTPSLSQHNNYASSSGQVCIGTDFTTPPGASSFCDISVNCVSGACSATRYYRGCTAGSTTCTETGRVDASSPFYASANYVTSETNYKTGYSSLGSATCTQTDTSSCSIGSYQCANTCTQGKQYNRCNGGGSCSSFWKWNSNITCNPNSCSSNSCGNTCSATCGADSYCNNIQEGTGYCNSNCNYVPSTVLSSPQNTTYTAIPPLNVTCAGYDPSYYVNRSVDGGASVLMGITSNNTLYTNSTTLTSFDGPHYVNVSCYNGTHINTSTALYYTSNIPPTWSSNSTNSSGAGKPILFSLRWADNVALSSYRFYLDNCTGNLVSLQNSTLSGSPDWSNVTQVINSTLFCTIRWNVSANDTSNNWNYSDIFSFKTLPSYCDFGIESSPYTISQSNKYYCVINNISASGNGITFAQGVQNSTLDGLEFYINGSGSNAGVNFSGSNVNNTVKNIYITHFGYGIYLNSTSNNTVTGGSIDSSTDYDYYLSNTSQTDNFISTNFTIRKIGFADATSWFGYNNYTNWSSTLYTNLTALANITRKLTWWNITNLTPTPKYDIMFNDSASSSVNATYNFTNLINYTGNFLQNRIFLVIINNSLSVKPNTSDAGYINFTVSLSTADTNIYIKYPHPPLWSDASNYTPPYFSNTTLSQINVTWEESVNNNMNQSYIDIWNSSGYYIANNTSMSNATYGGSIWNYSIILPAGTWYWRSYANDADQPYPDLNGTDIFTLSTINQANAAPVIQQVEMKTENLGSSEVYTLIANYSGCGIDCQNYTTNDISTWYFDGWGQVISFDNSSLVLNLTSDISFPFSKNLTLNDTGNLPTKYNVSINLQKPYYYQNETGTTNRTYQLIAYNATWTNNAPLAINITWNFSSPQGSTSNVTANSGNFSLNPSSSQNQKTVWYGDWVVETNESWKQDLTRTSVANGSAYSTHNIWLNNSWNFTLNNLNIEEYLTNRTDITTWSCSKTLTLNVNSGNNTYSQPINCSANNILLGYQTLWDQNTSIQSNTSIQYINTTINLTSADSFTYTNVSYTHPNLCPNNFTCSGFSTTTNYTVPTSGNVTFYSGSGNAIVASNTTWSQDVSRTSTETIQYINYTVNLTRNDTSPSVNFTNVYYPTAGNCSNNFSALGSAVPNNYTVNFNGNVSTFNCSGNVILVSNIPGAWAQNTSNTSQTIDSQNINETIRLLRNDTGPSNSIIFDSISYTVPGVYYCTDGFTCYPDSPENVASWYVPSSGNTTMFRAYGDGIINTPSDWQQNLSAQSSVSNVYLNQSLYLENWKSFALSNLSYSSSDLLCAGTCTNNCPNGFACSGMSGNVSFGAGPNVNQTVWANASGDVLTESQTNWLQNTSKTSDLSIQYINSTISLTRTDGSSLTFNNISYSIIQCPSNSSSVSPTLYRVPTSGNLTYLACSGDNITESWISWQQDWTKTSVANSTAYVTRNITVKNNATNQYLNFSNLQTNWQNQNRSSPWSCNGINTININYNSWNNTSMAMNCTADNIIQIKSAFGNWQQDTIKTSLANGTVFVEGDSNYTSIDSLVSYTNVQVNATSYNSTLDRNSWTCSFNNSRSSSLNFAISGNNSTSNKPIQCSKINVIQPVNTSNWVQDNSSITRAAGYAYVKGKSYFNNTDIISYSGVAANSTSYHNATLRRDVSWNCLWSSSLSESLNFNSGQTNQTNGYSVLCNQNNTISKTDQSWNSDNSTEQNITKQWILKKVNGTNADSLSYVNVNYTINEFPSCKSGYSCNVTTENITISSGAWERWVNASNSSATINTVWTNRYVAPTYYQNISINDTGDITFYNLTAWTLNFNDANITAGTEYLKYWNGTQWIYITPTSTDSNCNTPNPSYTSNSTVNGTFYVCKKDTDSNGKIDYFKFKIPHTSSQIFQAGGSDITLPQFNKNGTNTSIPNYNKPVLIYSNWSDDIALDRAWLWTNETGGNGVNYSDGTYSSPVTFTTNVGWSNFTWQNISLNPKTLVNWKVYANDTSGNANITEGSFRVWGWANVTEIDISNLYQTNRLNRTVSEVACRIMDANLSIVLENYNVSFYKNNTLQNTSLTNSTGYAVWYYNSTPDQGPYVLKCNITDDPTVFYNKSSDQMNSTVYVWRKLYMTLTANPTEIYRIASYQPDQSNLQAHLYDDNSADITSTQVCFYRSYSGQDLDLLSCPNTNATGYASRLYNGTSLNDNYGDWPPQNYTIYVNHSSLSYSYNASSESNIIISGKLYPNITDPLSGDKFYKNQAANLSSVTKDEYDNTVTPNSTNWTLAETSELMNQSETGQWNISINHGLGNFTVNYSVSKDWFASNWTSKNISIFGYSAVNETGSNLIYRGSSSKYIGTVYDYYNSSVIADYACRWWLNASNEQNATTNSTGNCEWNLITTCSNSAGPYLVNVSIDNNTSLFYDASANGLASISINLTGNLSTSIDYPSSNSIWHRGDNISVNSTVTDDCSNKFDDSNASAKWYLNNLNANNTNSTISIPIDYGKGQKTIINNVTADYYVLGANSTNVYIYGWANVTNITPNSETVPRGSIVTITCHVGDANTSENLENYIVNFYKDDGLQNTSLTNSTGYVTWNWNTTGDGAGVNYSIKCNISDNETLFYNKSYPYEQNITIGLSSGISIDSITKDRDTISRNDSYINYVNPYYETTITIHAIEAALGDSNASNVSFYNSTNLIGNCTTNETGYCNTTFNPPDNTVPQNYTIYVNATKSGYSPSQTNLTWVEVRGAIPNSNVNILYPLVSPKLKLYRGDSSWFNSSITDENNQPLVSATVNWRNVSNPSGYLIGGPNLTDSGGNGNSYGTIPINHPLGDAIKIYELITKSYFDTPSPTPSRDIRVWGWSNVSVLEPSSGNINRGTDVNVLCRVTDANTSESLSGYQIRFWNDSTNAYNSNSNSTGYSNYTWNTTTVSVGQHKLNCTVLQNSTKFYDGDSNISSVDITLLGNLTASLVSVSQATIYRNASCSGCSPSSSNITIHITDEYSNAVSGANVSFYQNDDFLGYCPTLTDSTGNCTYTYNPSDTLNPGSYSIKFNASASNYYSSNTVETLIEVKGQLYASIVYAPSKIYRNDWTWLNSTTVDENGNLITPDSATWRLAGNWIASGENVNYTIPSNRKTESTQFTYVSTKSFYDDSNLATQNTQIWTKANVTLYLPLDATYNRGSSIVYYANVTDIYNNSPVQNYICSWRLDGVSINTSITNSQGTCNWTWSTGCSNVTRDYAGLHTVNSTITSNSTLFYDPNINNSNTSATLQGVLNIKIDSPGNNTIWHKTDLLWLNSTVKSECSAETITGPSVNWTLNDTQIGTGVNTTWAVSQNQNPGPYIINSSANKTYYNSTFNTSNIQVWGWSNVSWVYPSTGDYGHGQTLAMTCKVLDANNSTAVSGYNVTFYKNNSFYGSNTTVSGGNTTLDWDTSEGLGIYIWKCNITDNSSLYYNKSAYESTITINVTDSIPPRVENLTFNPPSLEANYASINITVDVWDSVARSQVWANIKGPSYNQNLSMTYVSGNTFNLTFIPTQGGLHNVTIYANDSSNNVNSTQGNFTSIGNTTGITLRSPADVEATGITRTNNYTFEITATLNNTGSGTMRFVNMSLTSVPSGFYSNSTLESCSNLTPGSNCTKTFKINVTTLADEDTYPIMNINSTWQNPDYSTGYATNSTTVHVVYNSVLFINETEIVSSVNHSQWKNVGNFTIYPWGNTMLLDVNLSIAAGNLTESWLHYLTTPQANPPWAISPKTSNKSVIVNISIPLGQDPGFYWSNLTANATGCFATYNCNPANNCWDSLWLNITVPEDKTWYVNPQSNITSDKLFITISTGSSGNFNMTLNNSGNVNRTWSVTKNWAGNPPSPRPTITNNNPISVSKATSSNITFNWGTSGVSGGNYTLQITFTNTSVDPTSKDIYVYMNVTDPVPQIDNANVSPSTVDENYGNANIKADIQDNIQVDYTWINLTKPDTTSEIVNNTSIGYTPYNLSYNYTPNQTGIYYVVIYAMDSAGGTNQTSQMSFTSVGNTNLSISSNSSSVNVPSITQDSGNSFALNISINDTGQSGAYYTNQTFELPSSWSASPTNFSYNNITAGSFRSNASTITVPKATDPGTYYVNASVAWLNPNNTLSTNKTTITVNVLSNPVLNIVESSMSMALNHGSSNSTNFTLNSTGNTPVTNILINCTSGNCTDLNISFNPSSLSSLSPMNSANITANASAYLGFPSGNYPLTLNASGTGTSDTVNLTVNVLENKTWNKNPDSFSQLSVGLNVTGDIGTINITNYGNLPITFNVSVVNTTENATDHIFANVSSIAIDKQSSGYIKINYSTPDDITQDYVIYSANISIGNSTATPSYPLNISASIKVYKFKVNILSPTQSSPVSLYSGNLTTIHANATLGDVILGSGENITWNVSFGSTSCPLSGTPTHSSYWTINCTAPSLTDGSYYTLNIIGTYTNISAGIVDTIANDNEPSAIHYVDITPPSIIPYINSVQTGSTAQIRANITDNVAVSKAIAEITYPNATKFNYTMTNISSATWEYNLTNAQLGDYDVKVYSNDTANNWNSNTSWFEVYYDTAWLNGTALDSLNIPISVSFNLYRPNTTTNLYSFSSNATGNYSKLVNKRYYDFIVNEFNNTLNLTNVSINTNINNATLSDNIPVSQIGSGIRISKAMYIQTILNYTNALLVLNYTGTSYTAENYLGVYRCNNWSFSNRTCNSTWSRISSTLSIPAKTLTVNTTDLSGAYAAAEFICGDGVCETTYGESNAVCPTDCPAPVTPSGPGGGGGGGGTTTIPEIETSVPISLTTSLLEIRLYPGEYQISSIGITNNKKEDVPVTLTVEGDIWPFTLIEKDKITVGSKQTEYARIKFFTMPTTIAGVYNGNIIVKSPYGTQRISVILRVEYEREKLLDIKVDAITKEVIPGQKLKYQVTLYNLGLTKRVDVFINYTVKSVEGEKIITVDKETMAVETSLSFLRFMTMPEKVEPGLYTIEAVAWYENKTASSVSSFNVVSPPWIWSFLLMIFTNWITYVILFVAIPCFYLGWKAFEKYKVEKRVRARYIRPINENKLPQKGLWLGKIAETNSNAYFDDSKLTTHMIIAGGTGSGKTVAGMVIAEECLKKGTSVIVFDPTAQWTGFIRPSKDKAMQTIYQKFGIKQEEARGFKGTIVQVKDPFLKVEIEKYIKEGEITVFVLNKLTPDQLDYFVRKTLDYMFTIPWEESRQLKTLIVFDEVHRLLPKYSRQSGISLGGGEGYLAIERACREFRKWGLGLMMISQVLLDFRGAIRAVIATESQMRTKYEGDIERIKTKYGWEYSTAIPKLEVGTGMIQNSEYNDGKPWFIRYRPLLHDSFRLTEEELNTYEDYSKTIEELGKKIETLKSRNIDTYDMELELKLASDKVKTAQVRMAETYIESVKSRIKSLEK